MIYKIFGTKYGNHLIGYKLPSGYWYIHVHPEEKVWFRDAQYQKEGPDSPQWQKDILHAVFGDPKNAHLEFDSSQSREWINLSQKDLDKIREVQADAKKDAYKEGIDLWANWRPRPCLCALAGATKYRRHLPAPGEP